MDLPNQATRRKYFYIPEKLIRAAPLLLKNDENIFLSITANFYRGIDFSRIIIETCFFAIPVICPPLFPPTKQQGKLVFF